MKNKLIVGLIGIALLAGTRLMAAEQHSGDYCSKHCNAMQIRKEIKSLEKQIEMEKSEMKGTGSEKLATLMSKKDKVKKHFAQHEKELMDLKTELEKAEAELNQMGGK